MKRILQAARFAAERHAEQRRKNPAATPYINHPLEVAEHLSTRGGIDDEDLLVAALLHDTLEDTATRPEELEAMFGERVRSLVEECSDDKGLEKAERKRLQIAKAPHKSPGARLIKIADKTCNLRSILADPPDGWSRERQAEYFAWAEQVLEGLFGVHEELERLARKVLAEGRESFGDRP